MHDKCTLLLLLKTINNNLCVVYVCVSLCFRTHMCPCLDKNLVHRDQCCRDDILTNQQKEIVHIMYNES